MSSVTEAFSDSIMERAAIVKIFLYAIPVFLTATSFIAGDTVAFNFWKIFTAIIFFGALTFGIYNVKHKHEAVLTLNPIDIVMSIIKAAIVVVPHAFVWYYAGLYVLKIFPKLDLPYFDIILQSLVWALVGSIIMTAYMCFAVNLQIPQGFNLKKIFSSGADIFVCVFFFIPQLLIADAIIIAPVMYVFTFLEFPLTHWGFVWYCSMVAVINLSVFANYLAQATFEHIQLDDDEYQDKYLFNDVNFDEKKNKFF